MQRKQTEMTVPTVADTNVTTSFSSALSVSILEEDKVWLIFLFRCNAVEEASVLLLEIAACCLSAAFCESMCEVKL